MNRQADISASEALAQRAQVRQRIKNMAYWLDDAIGIPGTRWRVGFDALIGFIPGIGDVLGLALGLWLVQQARSVGAPAGLQSKMLGNLVIETVVGLVPVLGDAFDLVWKANNRNRDLLLDWMDQEDRIILHSEAAARPMWPWVALIVVVAALSLAWLFYP